MKKRRLLSPTNAIANHPTIHKRGSALFRRIETSLSEAYGRKLTLYELGHITDQSISTIFDWRTDSELPQLESVLCLIERLRPARRAEILNWACRQLPTIWEPCFAWKDEQVSVLQEILRQQQGLTILHGDESDVGYVTTALGHSSWRLDAVGNQVCGLDARTPERFVPVDGLMYLGFLANNPNTAALISRAWKALRRLEDHTVFLHGGASMIMDGPKDLLRLPRKNHVILSGVEQNFVGDVLKLAQGSGQFLLVGRESEIRIRISVKPFS